jgi:hypothetical protein
MMIVTRLSSENASAESATGDHDVRNHQHLDSGAAAKRQRIVAGTAHASHRQQDFRFLHAMGIVLTVHW